MRNFSKIAVAVAATLAGSSAFALVGPTTSYTITLNVAGSSAFRDTFKTEMGNVLCSDSVVQFAASSANTPDFRAYGCTVKTSITLSDGTTTYTFPANTPILAYYRSEGGSDYGVGPLVKKSGGDFVKQLRLVVDNNCTGSSTSYVCLTAGFNLVNDTFTSGNLVKDFVQLGVSDLEPAQFVGENWPGGFLGTEPTAGDLANLTSIQSAIGQAFAVYVNTGITGSAATPLYLSKQSLTSIFSGLYADWSQVPNAAGTGFVTSSSLPIVVCERDVGSGTQAGASIYFNGQNCSSAPYSFVVSSLARNASTGAELTCINSHAGGIGYAAVQGSAAVGTSGTTPLSVVNIDGIAPGTLAAANGNYGYWFEATFQSGAKLAANANATKLANVMVDRLKTATTIPASSPSAFALPIGTNVPTLPQADSTRPISLGTRGGNSCALPVGQN